MRLVIKMRRVLFVILMALAMLPARAAYECNKQAISGPYGFQLSGMTTISGTSAPAVGIARIVFDGDGNISGYSSVNYNGLLLGNPVTGTYEVATDCAVHFRGGIRLHRDFRADASGAGRDVPISQVPRHPGRRRQGNPGHPDRPRRIGLRAIHGALSTASH